MRGTNINERIKREQRATKRITNDDLVCKNCIYKLEKTSKCKAYSLKPDSIICGGNCPYRKIENE